MRARAWLVRPFGSFRIGVRLVSVLLRHAFQLHRLCSKQKSTNQNCLPTREPSLREFVPVFLAPSRIRPLRGTKPSWSLKSGILGGVKRKVARPSRNTYARLVPKTAKMTSKMLFFFGPWFLPIRQAWANQTTPSLARARRHIKIRSRSF